MANIATNEVLVVFKTSNVATKEDFMADIKDEIELWNDPDDEVTDEDNNTIQLSFGSKWSAPIKLLQLLCNTYKCNIYGVCYEWGNAYVESYVLSSEEELFEVIAQTTKPEINEN